MADVIIPTSDDVSGATPGTALVPLVTGEDEIKAQTWATMRAEAAAAATDTVPSASNIYPLLKDLLVAGANITLTDNDTAETVTITGAAAGTPAAQRTREQIIDLLTGDSGGDIVLTRDGSGSSADLRGQLRANSVDTVEIADGAVGTAQLDSAAVTSAKIATGAVGAAAIGSGEVGTTELADSAVTAAKMADDAVGTAELSATGTPSGTTYLRGDNTWATPPAGGGGPTSPTVPPEKFETRSTAVPGSAATTNAGILLATAGSIVTAHTASTVTLAAGRYLVSVTATQAAPTSSSWRAYPQFVLRNGTTAVAVSTSTYFRGATGAQSFQLFTWLDLSAETALTPAWRRQEYHSGQSDAAFTVGPAVVTVIPVGAGTSTIADGSVTTAKLADDAVTEDKLADDAVTAAKLSATGTPSGTTYLRGDNTWATPPTGGGGGVPDGGTTGQALVKESDTDQDVGWADAASGDSRDIEGSNTIYVNPAGADDDPARPQLWAPTVVGGVWANDGSEEHTTARPIAKPLAIDQIASTDTRVLTHRYSYRFTESAGTQRVDENSRRVQSFPNAQGTGSVDTRPEWEWDGTANEFNQRNRAATVANWGSTTLTNRITVTVPLEGPGWVEGIELECRLLRGSVAAVNIPANGLVQTHVFPDSSHPRPSSVQFSFEVTNNQIVGDHQQKLWCDLAINGAHASLERGPVTIEFASPFLGLVPVVSGNFSGRQQGILVGYADNVTDPSLSYMRQEHYFENINGTQTDRGVAYYVATVDLAKLVLNCYSKPPNDEVAANNEGTLSLWTELDGVISRHVVASRVCHVGERYNLYATIRGVLAGQRFWWTYDSHEDVGALSNNPAIGNPMADWDANRTASDPTTNVVVPGLRRTVVVYTEPSGSRSERTILAFGDRPVPVQKWVSLRIQARVSSGTFWVELPMEQAARMITGDYVRVEFDSVVGRLRFITGGGLQLTALSGSVRLTSVRLVHWL